MSYKQTHVTSYRQYTVYTNEVHFDKSSFIEFPSTTHRNLF